MNTSHYPSLELCKKLTEIGFPVTELFYETDDWSTEHFERIIIRWWRWKFSTFNFVCPSVMEMLDIMPASIIIEESICYLWIEKDDDWEYVVFYQECIEYEWCSWRKYIEWTLPNALAKMYLWLKENNYLPSNQNANETLKSE